MMNATVVKSSLLCQGNRQALDRGTFGYHFFAMAYRKPSHESMNCIYLRYNSLKQNAA